VPPCQGLDDPKIEGCAPDPSTGKGEANQIASGGVALTIDWNLPPGPAFPDPFYLQRKHLREG
jgi:hypothetical protein